MKRSELLDEAKRLVCSERNDDYGPPKQHLESVALIASELIGKELTPDDIIVVMLAMKLVRERNKHKSDNLVDIAGYVALREEIASA